MRKKTLKLSSATTDSLNGLLKDLKLPPVTKELGSGSFGQPTPSESALDTQVGGNHYKLMRFQPAEYIHANGLGFIEGNVIKYVSRWRHKNGLDDLRKAQHMLGMLIELEERSSGTQD